jgi:hypothetical protein
VYRIDIFFNADIKTTHADDDLLENFFHKHCTFLSTKQTDIKENVIFKIVVIFMMVMIYFPGVKNVWGVLIERTNLLLVDFVYSRQEVDDSEASCTTY